MSETATSSEEPIVVVVDDDYGNRLALCAVLQPVAKVVAFGDGESALRYLLTHVSCAALILDVHMGKVGGFEIARLMSQRERTKEIPVIFVTGTMRDAALEGYAEGAYDFITKPFDPEPLRAKVAGLVKLHLRRRAAERDRDASLQREHSARAESTAQRKYLYDFLGQVPGLVAKLRGPTHIFDFVNDAYAVAIGRGALTGKPIREAFGPTVGDPFFEMLDEVYRTGIAASAYEVAIARGAGAEHPAWFNFVYQPIRGTDGSVEGIFVHGMDVTPQVNARKAVEALSVQLTAAVEEAGQLATLQEQVLAIVGHDLRNPLDAILLSAQRLSNESDDPDAARTGSLRIRRSGLRMKQIISDLYDFTQARLTGGIKVVRERCNVAELCNLVVDELATVHPDRSIKVEAPGQVTGEWDSSRLQQMISNLVANGLQYSPRDSQILVRVEDKSSEVLLQVVNGGSPIPEDMISNLFEPFKRGPHQAQRGNLGLGLYIVDQVARAHGGSVDVQSAEGSGTMFTVRLPRAA